MAVLRLQMLGADSRRDPVSLLRGLDQGTASFGIIATALITLAALVGAGLLATHILKRRIAGIMIGIHATLAVSGVVILTAYFFAG